MNGGTVLAIAGKDYCIVAGSTRLSTGYSILTRHKSKLNQVSQHCVLASGGFQGDITTLAKRLKVSPAWCTLCNPARSASPDHVGTADPARRPWR